MLKQTLMVSAVALGFVTGAFAGSLLEQPAPAPVAVGSDTGYYVGLEGGFGPTSWKDTAVFASKKAQQTVTIDDDSWVGRAFAGYDFSKYLAVEFGYTYFGEKTTAKADGIRIPGDLKLQTFDLVGKGSVALDDGFSVYAKFGPAYQMTKYKVSNVAAGLFNDASTKLKSNKLTVVYGVGVDYAVTSNVIVNGEYMHFNGSQKLDHKFQPAVNVYMVGARYKWDM